MSTTKKNIICYTGIGARKNGKHTRKQFLNVMKKTSTDCSRVISYSKCKTCKQATKMMMKYIGVMVNKGKKGETKQIEKKIDGLKEKCEACIAKHAKPCTYKNYIKYSGAHEGSCGTH